MSNPEQEQALSTIAALAHAMAGTKLTDIQLDLLLMAANLMTNIAVQSQIAATAQVTEQVPEFEIGEPVNVHIPATSVSHGYAQRATVTGKIELKTGFEYKTSATGIDWVTTDRMHKVQP